MNRPEFKNLVILSLYGQTFVILIIKPHMDFRDRPSILEVKRQTISHNDDIVLFSYFSICSMFGVEPGTALSGTLLSFTPVEPTVIPSDWDG
jgi:hypothetical protein